MKVLLVSQPASDGVFRHVQGLARYLIGQGATVHLAYSDRAACDQLPSLVNEVAAAGGRTLNLRVGNSPAMADLPAVINLHRLVRDTAPDVIHAHSSKAGALVRMLAFTGVKPRLFYTPHAYYGMHSPSNPKARFFHGIERVLGRYGRTIGLSSDEAEFAAAHIAVPPDRQRRSANGVDCERFRPPSHEEKALRRAEYGVPEGALVLGTVGRFSRQKDPATTYAGFAKAAAIAPDLFFLHLGEGELEPQATAILERSGMTARARRIPYLADTAPFYHALDGFLLASIYEGMSFAALEAIATGLPLVLTRVIGNNNFANFGLDRIWWAEPEDADSVAAAILAWRDEMRKGIACNHREVALREFTLERAYSRVLAAYREP